MLSKYTCRVERHFTINYYMKSIPAVWFLSSINTSIILYKVIFKKITISGKWDYNFYFFIYVFSIFFNTRPENNKLFNTVTFFPPWEESELGKKQKLAKATVCIFHSLLSRFQFSGQKHTGGNSYLLFLAAVLFLFFFFNESCHSWKHLDWMVQDTSHTKVEYWNNLWKFKN